MTTEEIRQKALECGKAFETMCVSKEGETDEEYGDSVYPDEKPKLTLE